jgi:alpha-tubulin suppressor-like RCC1 family protein
VSSETIDFLADTTLKVLLKGAGDTLVFGVSVELSVTTDVATITASSGSGKGVKSGGSIRIHGQAQGSGQIAMSGVPISFFLTIRSPIATSVTIVGDDGQELSSPSLALGDSIHVRCLARDKNGHEIPTSWPAQNNGTDFLRCAWSLDRQGVSDSPETWIKPTTTDSHDLTVTVDQAHALVTIEVTQTVTSVTVKPVSPPAVGLPTVLQATGQDKYGNVVGTDASWSTDQPNDLALDYNDVGSVTANPRIAGTFTVHAKMQNVSTTYQLVVPALVFSSYTAGSQMTCAITNSGQTYCWGYGFGFDPSSTILEQRNYPVPVAVGHTFTQVAVGYAHACGRESTGHVFCWGQSAAAGSTDYLPEPIEVSGNHIFSSIAAGLFHTCGISSGQLYCWGDNTSGQLGNPAAGSSSSIPVLVSGGLSWTQVALGQFHTCGISGGKAYCWGSNGEGQIGIGTVTGTSQQTPIEVASDPTGWTQISSLNRHTCGIAGGRVYCWGEGLDGEIGDGGNSIRSTPTAISSSQSFSQISAGTSHSCAMTTGGQVYCWGDNSYGEFGNGGTTSSTVPVPAASGLTFSSVQASSTHSCGVTTAGPMYCWGFNQRGVLGIDRDAGTIDGGSYVSPTKVASQP